MYDGMWETIGTGPGEKGEQLRRDAWGVPCEGVRV